MDKGVLLVLLCLQAFLLITAFTSTDAAALVKDDHQQQSLDLEGTAEKGAKLKFRIRRNCWRRPGGCDVFKRPSSRRHKAETRSHLKEANSTTT